jgi:hypothetical protein
MRMLLAVLCGVVLAGWFATLFAFGQRMRAEAERAEAATIEQEDRSFCTGLGHAFGTDLYSRCSIGLGEIRRTQRERWEASTDGLL